MFKAVTELRQHASRVVRWLFYFSIIEYGDLAALADFFLIFLFFFSPLGFKGITRKQKGDRTG